MFQQISQKGVASYALRKFNGNISQKIDSPDFNALGLQMYAQTVIIGIYERIVIDHAKNRQYLCPN